MRLAFVSQPIDSVRPPVQNSLGHWTFEMARRAAREHEVVVYAKGGGRRFRDLREDGLHYRLVPMRWDARFMRLVERLPAPSDPRRPRFARTLHHAVYARLVARDLARRRPDGIHVLNYSQFVPPLRARNPRAKIALHMQCEWLHHLDPALLRPRLGALDWIVGCSDYITRCAGEAHPALAERCHTVHNGVDVAHFTPGPPSSSAADAGRGPKVVYVGRISPEKGVHVLVEAFERIHARFPEATLELVGGIDTAPRDLIVDLSPDPVIRALGRFYDREAAGVSYREQLAALLSPAARSRTHFHGERPHRELLEHYRGAAVFAMPSSCHEAFGMPLAEAMACGRACVCCDAGGMPEVVAHGETGFVVPREDPQAMADAIAGLLEDPARRAAMGEASRERARERFAWDVLVERLLALYE